MGIIGGAMAKGKPKAAGIMMIISAVGGMIAVSLAYIIPGILLVIGGVLALIESKKITSANENTISTIQPGTVANKPFYRNKWFLGGTAAILLLIGLGIAMGGSSETQTKQEKKADSFQYDYSVSFAGEGIYKGIYASNVGLAIIEINKMESIGKGKSVKNAQGEYLVIGIAVTNEQKDKITMDHRAFKIIDKEGRVPKRRQ